MSEMEHHLEHAEHAQHAAHDPFDRRVTMTIAIIAAMLACVTLLSHRAHNETLQLQIEASSFITKGADKWNQYQAKKNRRYQYEASMEMVRVLAKDPGQKYQDEIAAWKGKVETYKKDADDLQEEARELDRNAEEHKMLSEHIHHIGDRYDLGELGVEIGLVLCSIAVLTKRAGFWYSGIGAAGLGAVLAAIGVYGQYFHFH